MIQSQTQFLDRLNMEILRVNSQCPIHLKTFKFRNTWTVSESGEFEEDCISGIGQTKMDCYWNILFPKTYVKEITCFAHISLKCAR